MCVRVLYAILYCFVNIYFISKIHCTHISQYIGIPFCAKFYLYLCRVKLDHISCVLRISYSVSGYKHRIVCLKFFIVNGISYLGALACYGRRTACRLYQEHAVMSGTERSKMVELLWHIWLALVEHQLKLTPQQCTL